MDAAFADDEREQPTDTERERSHEGLNNKIRVLQRRAYGYRDEEYLKLKIISAFLPPLPRGASRSPL